MNPIKKIKNKLGNSLGKLFNEEIIGLDIGDNSIKITSVNSGWGRIELKNYSIIKTPNNTVIDGKLNNINTLAREIKSALEYNDFKAGKVVAAISGEEVISRTIEIPSMPKDELNEAVRWEAEDHIPIPLDGAILDYEILNRNKNGSYDLMIIAVKKELIEAYIELFNSLNLEPIAIEIEPTAIARTVDNIYSSNTSAIIDIGKQATAISVLNDGQLLFTRTIGIGGASITEEIVDKLNLEIAEAEDYKKSNNLFDLEEDIIILDNLMTAIYRSLDYFDVKYNDNQIDQIILTGGSCKLKGLTKYLKDEFKVEIERLNLVGRLVSKENNFATEKIAQIAPLLGTSIGLALRKEEEN